MSTTLPHGIIQINEGNISWYGDITANWQLIDSKIGIYDAAIASIPAPANNGTLTIQQNGTDVQTFTANASTNATANIQCVDLASNQTVAGNKEFTGTTTAHDVIPSATDTYNFGSSSAQWNNAYIKSLTINGAAAGDILTHNASEFVDVTSAQTIAGVKTFINDIRINKASPRLQMKSTTYSSETSSAMTVGDIAFLNNSGGFSSWILDQLRDNLTKRLCFRVYPHAGGLYKGFAFDETCNLHPESSGSALGTSTNKWKSFNGLNPGALSLPSNSYVNVDTTNWDVAGGTNVYTPPANGWLHIRVVGATELMVRWSGWGFGDRRVSATATDMGVTIPVVAGVTVDVVTVASGFDGKCQFFPCQGNV